MFFKCNFYIFKNYDSSIYTSGNIEDLNGPKLKLANDFWIHLKERPLHHYPDVRKRLTIAAVVDDESLLRELVRDGSKNNLIKLFFY